MLPMPSYRRLNEFPLVWSSQERRIEDAVDVLFTKSYKLWEHSAMLTDLSNMGGCYVFKDKRGMILYVGEGKDLYRRICKQHIRGGGGVSKSCYRYIYEIDVYVIDNSLHALHGREVAVGLRKSLELILIKKLRPYTNLVKMGSYKPQPYFNYLNYFKDPISREFWPLSEQNLLSAHGTRFKI